MTKDELVYAIVQIGLTDGDEMSDAECLEAIWALLQVEGYEVLDKNGYLKNVGA
jgi:hypothetical protein